ncbi:MAG TPA: hypothetical protein VFO59_07985, partial [Dehalococcoidia bacterium]|nr:hypothetical protein [Dehalococcoidia bacterium]
YTVDAFGTATFSVQHTYPAGIPTPITATLEVHDSAGGNGSDETHIVCDPSGDAPQTGGDWIGCGSSNTSTQMSIAVTVAGQVVDNFQYRINLDVGKYNTKKKKYEGLPDGIVDATLKYNGGQTNGAPSLTVQKIGTSQLLFKFNLTDFNLSTVSPRNQLRWYGETQAGLPGEPGAGQIDRIPDSGWFTHIIQ